MHPSRDSVEEELSLAKEEEELSLDQFLEIFRSEAKSPWGYVENDEVFSFHKIALTPEENTPFCEEVLTITKEDCCVELKKYGVVMDLADLFRYAYKDGKFIRKESVVKTFLQHLFNWTTDKSHHSYYKQLLHCASDILQKVDTSEAFKHRTTLKFVLEQLKLMTGHRTYNPATLWLAMLVRFHSTTAYRVLRDTDFMILPSLSTLDAYIVPPRSHGLTESRKKELKQTASLVHPEKRQVALIFDEMACQVHVSFDSLGKVHGYALNDPNCLVESILSFMISGLGHHHHQLIAFYPVRNPDSKFLQQCFLDCVEGLEQAGFQVMLSVCDNYSAN